MFNIVKNYGRGAAVMAAISAIVITAIVIFGSWYLWQNYGAKGNNNFTPSTDNNAQNNNSQNNNSSLTGAIQAEIRNLQNLKILNANNNQMTGVPAEIGQLQKLQILDLSDNKLTGLPNELGNLKNLSVLDISGNNYSEQDLQTIKPTLPPSTNIIIK